MEIKNGQITGKPEALAALLLSSTLQKMVLAIQGPFRVHETVFTLEGQLFNKKIPIIIHPWFTVCGSELDYKTNFSNKVI